MRLRTNVGGKHFGASRVLSWGPLLSTLAVLWLVNAPLQCLAWTYALSTGLTNPTPAAQDRFGGAVAAFGCDRLLVGAFDDDAGATNAGVAYLFGTNGALLTTFTNPVPKVNGEFGICVAAIGTDKAVIGALYNDTSGFNSGGAYLFNTNGALLTTFTNPAPTPQGFFAVSVGPAGPDKVLIGAPYNDSSAPGVGAAYLFGADGTLLTTFTNPAPAASAYFGTSVTAVGLDTVLIGAIQNATNPTDTGAAYLFSTNGTLLSTFTNPSPAKFDLFGGHVAALGVDRVLISAYQDDTGATDAGSVYLFNTNGGLLTIFTNPTPAYGEWFGKSLAVAGADQILIGAPMDGTGAQNAGAAYLFNTNGALLATILNPTPAFNDQFGWSVAGLGLDGILIGAVNDSPRITPVGAAYLFNLYSSTPPTLAIAPAAPGEIRVSWFPNIVGFTLQETSILSPPTWVSSATGATNPANLPAPQTRKFYRVISP